MLLFLAAKFLMANYPALLQISARTNLVLRLFLVPAILISLQLYHSVTLQKHFEIKVGHFDPSPLTVWGDHRSNVPSFAPPLHLPPSESFGACLMIKEDNDLLYEWLAYHYTTLPLRYVFVGSDEGNRHDPTEVLRRWTTAGTGLHYWVVNASDFVVDRQAMSTARMSSNSSNSHSSTSSKRRGNFSMEHEEAHHSFVHRQRSFISTCVAFLKSKGLKWVTLMDTDEFLVMNRVVPMENRTLRQRDVTSSRRSHPNEIDPVAFQQRHALPSLESTSTVLDAIHTLDDIQELGPCYTIPRLLYGALENVTCPEAASAVQVAQSKFRYEELSTLRFTQHAKKGDFSKSKYGKVMLDVSRLSNEVIERTPRNIHRPYKPECGPGAVGNFAESLFYLNHYIGSWERYASREDSRRNRVEWELRAHLTSGSSCEHGVFRWFSRFLDLVGEERAQYLLGGRRPTMSTLDQ